jgi:hypothetical protein
MELSEWASDFDLEQAQVAPSLLPSGRVPIRDSFYTAPGYREIGMFYSCVPDPAYPWDPKIVREIWKWAPDAVPMWVHWVFLSPQETGNPKIEIFGRHALGRVIKNRRGSLEPMRVLMPTFPCQGLTFEKPNDIWFIHQGPMGLHKKYKDLPGDYLPFDSDLVMKVAEASQGFKMTEAEYRAHLTKVMITDPIKRELARIAALKAERAYARGDVLEYVDRQYEKVGDQEALNHYRGRGHGGREKKPMVVVGSTP